tara:strand:+ start:2616 stop:2864 length:249 start_codon:yes stop_codon:yes gene_type:complete
MSGTERLARRAYEAAAASIEDRELPGWEKLHEDDQDLIFFIAKHAAVMRETCSASWHFLGDYTGECPQCGATAESQIARYIL